MTGFFAGFRQNPIFFSLFLHHFRHPFGAADQAVFFGTADRAEMADVEQMKKVIQLITCEISFGQDVCNLVFGVNVPDLNLGVQINSVKQPVKSNSVHVSLLDSCL